MNRINETGQKLRRYTHGASRRSMPSKPPYFGRWLVILLFPGIVSNVAPLWQQGRNTDEKRGMAICGKHRCTEGGITYQYIRDYDILVITKSGESR